MSKVLVIGDIIIDKYIYGTSERISPEAPVPIVKYQREVETLGGAGLVYENLKNLGVDVELYYPSKSKSVKTRVISDGHYLTRIDNDVKADSEAILKDLLKKDFSEYRYVILSDYDKGVLDKATDIIKHINKFKCKIIVDPKRHAKYWKNVWLVKPNVKEFKELEFNSHKGNIIITHGSGPIKAEFKDKTDNEIHCIFPDQVEVNDVTGAGDCFIASFVYGLTRGKSIKECLRLASKGATESVKHVGTYILSKEDLQDTVVFTNGVFDILHKGHFELLKTAHSLGHELIVGINSDESVKRLKGKDRPINNETARIEQLKSLPWVNDVVVFDDDTPYNLIKTLHPDIIVKGGDYTVDTVVGNDLAKVHIVPTVKGVSTTDIIDKMRSDS